MKIDYIREFSNELSILEDASPAEVLILSALLTKKRRRYDKDSVELIFSLDGHRDPSQSYRKWRCYEDFVKADDAIKMRFEGSLYDAVLKNADRIHTVKLDMERLNISSKNSLEALAFKCFVIAASQHSCNDANNDAFDISLYDYSKTMAISKIKPLVNAFLEEENIYAQLNGKRIHVFPKKKQEELRASGAKCHLIGYKDAEPVAKPVEKQEEPAKETPKMHEEPVAKPVEMQEEEVIEAFQEKVKKEIEENEAPEYEEDFRFDIAEEVEKWRNTYHRFEEKYGLNGVAQRLRKIQSLWGGIRETHISKICKELHIKSTVFDKFIDDRYVSDKDGGFMMKKALSERILELKKHILMAEHDDSWCEGNEEYGKLLISFAYFSYPKIMTFQG